MIIQFPGNSNPIRRVLFPQVVEFYRPAVVSQRRQHRVNQAIILNAPAIIATTFWLALGWAMWVSR